MGFRNTNYQGGHCPDEQKHVHELQGSVKTADQDDPHQHRFCTVSCEAIPCGEHDHVHEVIFHTDFFEGHFHEFCGKTGGAIPVGDRHVHFIESVTTVEDGHRHAFEAATLIENPTGKDYKKECEQFEEHKSMPYRRNDYFRR